MNKHESDRIQELCSKIAVEQDHHKFLRLVEELNRVLSAKEDKDRRITDNQSTGPKN
jgi:hypothetical protein